jgi:hypothetical protein
VAALYNMTGRVRENSGAIISFVGLANKAVEWRIVEGEGTLTPYTTYSDALGRCYCRYDPAGFIGRVVIGAAYVP